MLQGGTTVSEMQAASLPELPSREVGTLLLETVYLYTQARYCLVDWTRLREWHRRREAICYATKEDDLDAQIGTKPWLLCQCPFAALTRVQEPISFGLSML